MATKEKRQRTFHSWVQQWRLRPNGDLNIFYIHTFFVMLAHTSIMWGNSKLESWFCTRKNWSRECLKIEKINFRSLGHRPNSSLYLDFSERFRFIRKSTWLLVCVHERMKTTSATLIIDSIYHRCRFRTFFSSCCSANVVGWNLTIVS